MRKYPLTHGSRKSATPTGHATAASFDEARLARRWLLHQMKLARERNLTTIRVNIGILEALRPSIVAHLEPRRNVPRGPAAA